MNKNLLRKIGDKLRTFVRVASVFYVALVIFTNIPYFIDDANGTSYAPLFFLGQLIFAGLLALCYPGRIIDFVKSDVFKLILVFVVVYVANIVRLKYFMLDVNLEDWENALGRLSRFLIFPAIAWVLFLSVDKRFETFLLIGLFLIPVAIILNFTNPDLSPAFRPHRATGLYTNANMAAEAVCLWLLMLQNRFKGTILLVCALFAMIAVTLTFSRSGMIGVIIVLMYMLLRNRVSKVTLIVPMLIVSFYPLFLLHAENIISNFVEGDRAVEILMDRINFLGDIGSEEAIDDSSADARQEIFNTAWAGVLQRPIAGWGLEPHFVFGLASHNMLVDLWFTYGILGVILFLYITWLLFKSGRIRSEYFFNPYLLVFLWFTPFNHAHTTAPYWLVFIAYALTRVSSSSGKRKSRSQASRSGRIRKRRKSLSF